MFQSDGEPVHPDVGCVHLLNLLNIVFYHEACKIFAPQPVTLPDFSVYYGFWDSECRFLGETTVRAEDVHFIMDTSSFVKLAPVPGHLVVVSHEVSNSATPSLIP